MFLHLVWQTLQRSLYCMVRVYQIFSDSSTLTERVCISSFRIFKVIICQGRWKTEGFLYLSLCSVHLPSLHEWRAIFRLTFSQSDRIGNVKSLWKTELVHNNTSISLWYITKGVWTLHVTCWPSTGPASYILPLIFFYSEHYYLFRPFCVYAVDNSIIIFLACGISKVYFGSLKSLLVSTACDTFAVEGYEFISPAVIEPICSRQHDWH